MAPDLGLMEVEEAGDAVVGVGDGAAVSGTGGAGSGGVVHGEQVPEGEQVTTVTGVGVGEKGSGGAPLQGVESQGGGSEDGSSGDGPRSPTGEKRNGGVRTGGGTGSKVRPRESAPEPSLPVDDVGAGLGCRRAVS